VLGASVMTDHYEKLIDAALYPGAYKAIVQALKDHPPGYFVSITRVNEDSEWKLACEPYRTGAFERLQGQRASGVYTYPINYGICGQLKNGQVRKTLYQAAGVPPKWQQNMITLLYMPDGLPYGCNRFTGIVVPKPTPAQIAAMQVLVEEP